MKYKFSKTVVIALGGSIVHPDGIDVQFLKDFKKFLAPFLRRGTKFVLVVGGGKLSRNFQEAAGQVSRVTDEDMDWIGIHATRLNAHLLRTIFRDVADPIVIDIRGKIKKLRAPVTIASGWRPGWSTDYVAMRIAADFGVGEAIIAGKPAHVYNKDHAKFNDAVPIHELNWREYRKLIPAKWKPGLHAPVDPVGAALGAREGVKAIIIDGRNLQNFGALLNGKEFKGTIIGGK
jgi:uridylate kinase